MALGNDDNPNNGPSSNQNPFAYVLIPVLGFGLIVAVITCYRYRRKKQRLARLAEDPEYQRQLEEGRRERTQLDRGPNGVIIIAGDRGGRRGGGRSRRLGLGVGVGSREEGLNELGEAPPAYTPNAPKPPSEAGAEHIELTTYSQATAEAGMSRSPPMYGEEPPSPRSRSGPVVGTTSGGGGGARDSAGSSEEIREDDTRNATTGYAGDNPRTSEETRGEGAPHATTSGASNAARTSEETRGNTTGNATTTTETTTTETTTTTGSTTTTTPTTDEPTPPPRAVLPSS